jgi:ubiquinone biosynthesis protein COQ9
MTNNVIMEVLPPYDHESLEARRVQQQEAIVRQAMERAGFEGWSRATLIQAAVAAGYAPMDVDRLFPEGVTDVLTVYGAMLDRTLQQEVLAGACADMRTHERVTWLVKRRFELMTPHKEALRRAMAIEALPWRAGGALQRLWHACDELWFLAGDRSTDMNYYSKRLLLAHVVSSTALVWLHDDSPYHQQSWEFLDRRIHDVMRMGRHIAQTATHLTRMVEQFTDSLVHRGRYRTKRD